MERNVEEHDNELECDKKEDNELKVELSKDQHSTTMACKSESKSEIEHEDETYFFRRMFDGRMHCVLHKMKYEKKNLL